MIKRLLWLYTLLILVGCTKDEIVKNTTSALSGEEEFYATFEETGSRTYLNERILMRWNAEDHITLFKKNTYNRTYMFTGETGDNAGGFKQVSIDDEFWHGISMDYNYAVYPHSTKIKLDETDGSLTIDMPTEQTYAENSFGLGANTMVAIAEYNQLMFKNVCSSLRIRLYSNKNIDISSITLTANGDQAIAGMAKVTPVLDGVPTCEMTGSQKSIRLNCPTPVTVSTDAESPTDFWIVIPPITLNDGFSVTIEDSEGGTQTFNVSNSFTFKRNTYYNFTKEVNTTLGIPYITFTADEEQTLTMSQAVNTLEFSVNGGDWTELGTTTVTFGGENGKLKLRGKNLSGTGQNYDRSATIQFGNTVPVACTGDIRTLLNYENYSTVNTSSAKFIQLFSGCSNLTSAPELPATTLADLCYNSMFYNCTSLTKAPELPATKLTASCYTSMFYGCSSLISAPDLPATTLADACYNSMFYNCTSLISAPELPATKLTAFCYGSMFNGCSSLTSAPELPATTLGDGCYNAMFYGCSSLTKAPELPATTLTNNCYSFMFYKCSNLTSAPELPATTLTEDCYAVMFQGCTSLTTAPKLPATDLASSCYSSMFYNCTSLTKAPELPATNLEESCYSNMFYGCTSLTTAPELPATNLASSCYSRLFMGCSNLATAPELPATTLKSHAYAEMFSGCSKINNITMLATDINGVDCLYCWLYGVPSVGTFTKAKEMESLLPGYSGIPTGWKIKNYGTEENIPYVTFKANATQTFTLSKAVETLEYSVNGNAWTELGTKTISFGGTHGDLRLRGKNAKGTNGATISFGKASVPVASSGNILTLVDYDNYDNSMLDTSSAYFARLFQNCTALTSAPELPVMSLAFECYASMFSGCTSLTKAPVLPATTLIWGCYYAMFENCTSLTEVPDLLAPSMAPNCYSHMFYGCTSLTKAPKISATSSSQWSCYYMFYGCTSLETAPELPATSLGTHCYQHMFYGCSSLKTAPELPATTLSSGCYSGMFRNCTSLKTAPVLAATTLTSSCYNYMFYGCTNLNEVTMLATDISEGGLSNWLYNTAPIGTFIKAKEMTSLPSGVQGIPSGWTVKNYGE